MKTIVILGAGLAAVPIIRQTMVQVVLKRDDYKLVLVSPTNSFYYAVATPRAVIPGQITDDQIAEPLEPFFKEFPADKFEFLQGSAKGLDPTAGIVAVELNDGTSREVRYDTLIIATGSRAKDSMPWKAVGTISETKARLQTLRDQLSKAKTIVVAGGGITGVETAGEVGFEYSKSGKKEVYFVHSGDLPLGPPINDSVRKAARDELQKLKVKILPRTIVSSATTSDKGTVLELRNSDGSIKTMTVDAYLPATGVLPNTEFVPASLLNERGYVKQTNRLQVEGFKNIFVVGDAGSLEADRAVAAEAQAVHLIKALPGYVNGGEVAEYKPGEKVMFGVTLGRGRGTGQMGNMKVPSFIIWWFKSRTFGIENVASMATGKKTIMTTFEK